MNISNDLNPVELWEENQLLRQKIVELEQKINQLAINVIQEKSSQNHDILQENENQLKLALEASGDGLWDWNLKTNYCYYSPYWLEMLGYEKNELSYHINTWVNLVHRDDYVLADQALKAHFANHQIPYSLDHRLRTKKGQWKWIRTYGKVVQWDQENKPLRMIGFHRDIDQEKQMIEQLERSETLLQEAQRLAHCGSWDYDVTTGQIFWSAETFRIYGRDYFLGEPSYEELRSIIHPEDRDKYDQGMIASIEYGIMFDLEYRFYRPDNSLGYVYVKGQPLLNKHQKSLRLSGSVLDITEQKLTEIALKNSELKFRLITENSTDIICCTNGQNCLTYISPACQQIIGFTPEELIGHYAHELIHPDDLPIVRSSYTQITPETEIIKNIFRYKCKDDRYIWIEANTRILRDPITKTPCEFHSSARDITDRKQVEEKILELNRLQQAILNGSDYIIVATDAEGLIRSFNASAERLLGYKAEEVIGIHTPEIFHDPQEVKERVKIVSQKLGYPISPFKTFIYQAINQQKPELECVYIHKNGTRFPANLSISILRDKGGNISGFLGIAKDISHQKKAEAELRKINEKLMLTNAELAKATRLKDEFLANMSHELRTPLNAILGLSESLLEGILEPLNEKQRKAITTIANSGKHLLALINDILDLAKISAGKLQLHKTAILLCDLCESSINLISQQADKKNIDLKSFISPNLPPLVADELRLREVLLNLLSNAVKFTPDGGQVTLIVDYTPREIIFEITDTGIGIAEEDISKLFQSFVQLDTRLNRQYQGTGLGLVLVRQIVELHGGNVAVESKLGEGSCFRFTIPYVQGDFSLIPSQDNAIGSQSTVDRTQSPLILIAEDNPVNLDSFKDYLESKGYRLLIAKDGRSTVNLTQIHHPDLILMDIGMPDIDGLTATRLIRKNPECHHIPIIAITALAMPDDRTTCLAAGMNDYLSKPIRLKTLVERIEYWLSHSKNRQIKQ